MPILLKADMRLNLYMICLSGDSNKNYFFSFFSDFRRTGAAVAGAEVAAVAEARSVHQSGVPVVGQGEEEEVVLVLSVEVVVVVVAVGPSKAPPIPRTRLTFRLAAGVYLLQSSPPPPPLQIRRPPLERTVLGYPIPRLVSIKLKIFIIKKDMNRESSKIECLCRYLKRKRNVSLRFA